MPTRNSAPTPIPAIGISMTTAPGSITLLPAPACPARAAGPESAPPSPVALPVPVPAPRAKPPHLPAPSAAPLRHQPFGAAINPARDDPVHAEHAEEPHAHADQRKHYVLDPQPVRYSRRHRVIPPSPHPAPARIAPAAGPGAAP